MAAKKGLQKEALFSQLQKKQKAKEQYRQRDPATEIRARLFQLQLDFINDPKDRKTLRGGRRSGKTFAAIAYLILTCLDGPKRVCKYITLTKGRAKELIWDSQYGLRWFNEEFDLGIKFHGVKLTAEFPNGSRIHVAGAENYLEQEKLRGEFLHLAIIDECKSFSPYKLTYVVEECIVPMLMDYGGTLCLMGTPGPILKGIWYESSRVVFALNPDNSLQVLDKDQEVADRGRPYFLRGNQEIQEQRFYWSQHYWTAKENSAQPEAWPRCLKEKADRGYKDDNPKWRREYLAEWFTDHDSLMYAFDRERNGWTPDISDASPFGLPLVPEEYGYQHKWKFLLGLDFGVRDDTAFVVAAYADTSDTLYFIEDYKAPALNTSKVAQKILELQEKYGGFETIVGDQSAAQTILTLNEVHGLNVQGVKKLEKGDWVSNINSDLHDGRIMVNLAMEVGEGLTMPMSLADEWLSLTWDESGLKAERYIPDHAADAALYLYRFSRHLFGKPLQVEPKPGQVGFDAYRKQRGLEKFLARLKREQQFDDFKSWSNGSDADDDGWF